MKTLHFCLAQFNLFDIGIETHQNKNQSLEPERKPPDGQRGRNQILEMV